MIDYNKFSPFNYRNNYAQSVSIPIELYESLKGEYFIGHSGEMTFRTGTSAWARLYNPDNSGVNLHVNVWTVTDISEGRFRVQFWFNAKPPMPLGETSVVSKSITPTNLAIQPLPQPKVKLEYASNVVGEPVEGVKVYVRRGTPGTTMVEVENGKLILPPGGSFLAFISLDENIRTVAGGRVAFGWWEDKI